LARIDSTRLSDVLGNKQCQHAVPASSQEALLAERIAAETRRSPYDREVMNAEEAADFLRLSPTAFRRLAPAMPRCQIYERSGDRYLRSNLLLAWLRVRGNPTAFGGTRRHKDEKGPAGAGREKAYIKRNS
jgi:hypothetical protein